MKRTAFVTLAILLLLAVSWFRPEPRSSAGPVELAATKPASRPVESFTTLRGHNGFWRLGQSADGVWWFVSPAGEKLFLNAVTTVQPFQLGRGSDGPDYISKDYGGTRSQPGDLDQWAQATLRRVHDLGLRGLGAWCNPIFHKYDIPMTRDLNLVLWMQGAHLRLYSADWPTVAEQAIRSQVEPLKDNRNLAGYYIDNELDWGDTGAGPAVYFDYLPPDDPNRREVLAVVKTIWPTVAAFNADWRTELHDWADIDNWKTLPHDREPYGRLFTAWLSHVAEDYFRLSTGLIRKYDPNHLILGVRFKAYAPREVVRASRDYTDAQSINTYVNDARLDGELFRMMYETSGQPVIVSEYSFHSLDGRSGNRNTVGFAAQVLDQRARADAYRLFTTRVARVPYIVGADWFQWADEPTGGRSSDGEDVNFGIMDVDDRPYELLADAIRKTSPLLDGLHVASSSGDKSDIWRESFANKPVAHVPFLAKPPILNGELSDWPAEAKLTGIRHSQTIGLERSSLPLPNCYLGWTWEGLYVGLEVFDNDIQAVAPNGWWWTRDHMELWLSTRPVASDQNGYNEFCHQFFFVPLDTPYEGRFVGCVGQWHRPGDALKDSLVPHPQLKQGVRILPDRYVLEMFIPAQSLNGFDPKSQPALAFNLYVRNYQHAIDYFWSAPKEVMTQLRPNTWGPMYLDMPTTPVAGAAASAAQPSRAPQ